MIAMGPYRLGLSPPEFLKAQQERLDRLAVEGLLATAIVSESKRTDGFPLIGEEGAMIDLVVMVCPEDRPAFSASFSTAVALRRLENYAPGRSIWVRYNPNDRNDVDIDFKGQRGTVASQ